MEKREKVLLQILDAIRIVNVLNISLLIGMLLSFTGINKYVCLLAMLTICMAISVLSVKIFRKTVLKDKEMPRNTMLMIFSLIFILLIMIYYLYMREYAVVLIVLIFLAGCFGWMLLRKRNKKLLELKL